MNFVIMGIDRIGKDTFIENILKPSYPDLKITHLSKPPEGENPVIFTKREYVEYFMDLMKNDDRVYNRGHIDEMVYAPLYRNLDTYWLKIYEDEFSGDLDNTVFIVLVSDNNFDAMVDDGNSLDYSKRKEEQELFLKHFYESRMRNKLVLYTIDSNGYRSIDSIRADFEDGLKALGIKAN